MDFTIAGNKGISDFLEDKGTYVPTQEIIYLHTHPLIYPTFLSEINDLMKTVGEKIISKNVRGKPINDLSDIFIEIASKLPDINEDNAETILLSIKKLYGLLKRIDSTI